ncbi:GNAT family N-acetyltransferase [Segnochrobactrum spirostomi]|uniref:GNAT family N-acetyltransferase n=1 Tax=Segnochrobactrum spirostomi TaxID=2608987 RepID=A0A6A7Y3J9_9HYPH|nr:GNAT family N-acetyltransferase [Segnochrobactrum spirostomi]MQT13336.1 GNAT family N-acetyltransferase [Segnochrobactrum spirostomi]
MNDPIDRPVRLETERLVLDAHGTGHFEALCVLWSDPQVVRHIGKPSTPTECWARLLRYRGLWALLGFGYWAVTEKASGRFVGDLGFADFHRPIDPPIHGLPEAGWVLAPWAQGRGYASEALAAALGWLDGTTAHRRTACLIAPENRASVRVAEKAGFRFQYNVRFMEEDTLFLTRDRPA